MTAMRRIRVVSAAIENDGRYLVTQRKATAVLPLLWEFPGGRVEEGETDAQALERELLQRIGAKAKIGEHISMTVRQYSTYIVELHLYRCELLPSEKPRPVGVKDLRWLRSSEFDLYDFTPADQGSMDALLAESDVKMS